MIGSGPKNFKISFEKLLRAFVKLEIKLRLLPYRWNKSNGTFKSYVSRKNIFFTIIHAIFLVGYICVKIYALRTNVAAGVGKKSSSIIMRDAFLCFIQLVTTLNLFYTVLINYRSYKTYLNHWILLCKSKYCYFMVVCITHYSRIAFRILTTLSIKRIELIFIHFILIIGIPLSKKANKSLYTFSILIFITVVHVSLFVIVHQTWRYESISDLFKFFGGVSRLGHAMYRLVDYSILVETFLLGAHHAILNLCFIRSLLDWVIRIL